MEKVIIEIPSIRDNENGYEFLFKLANKIMADPKRHFDFNFTKCAILDHNAVAMLGGLATYVHSHNTSLRSELNKIVTGLSGVMFLVDTMSELISSQLIKNNFLKHFSNANFKGYPVGDYIGYREHTEYLDSNGIALHLHNEWLSDNKLSMSLDLKQAVVSRIFEIFMNAYGHGIGNSNVKGVGAFSCGQYSRKEGLLKLSVIDFGKGVVGNVQEFQGKNVSDINAMNWALIVGNSTRTDSTDNIPRGLGFGLLNDLVTVNKGSLSIYSNTCSAKSAKNGGYEVSNIKYPFNGTMVSITINCDQRHYQFVSETNENEHYF